MATPHIIVFGTIGVQTLKERIHRRSFDSETWKQGNQDEVRIRMIDSLLHLHNLTGMTQDQVVNLLGDPDNTSYFREYDMVYRLGNERGFISIDSEWLVLKYDSDKVITEHRIVHD